MVDDCAAGVDSVNDEAVAAALFPIADVDSATADAASHFLDAIDVADGEGRAVPVKAAADSSANCIVLRSSQPWLSVF